MTESAKTYRPRWTKVSPEQVRAIREAWASKSKTQQDMAREYGLTPSGISRICSGQSRHEQAQ